MLQNCSQRRGTGMGHLGLSRIGHLGVWAVSLVEVPALLEKGYREHPRWRAPLEACRRIM